MLQHTLGRACSWCAPRTAHRDDLEVGAAATSGGGPAATRRPARKASAGRQPARSGSPRSSATPSGAPSAAQRPRALARPAQLASSPLQPPSQMTSAASGAQTPSQAADAGLAPKASGQTLSQGAAEATDPGLGATSQADLAERLLALNERGKRSPAALLHEAAAASRTFSLAAQPDGRLQGALASVLAAQGDDEPLRTAWHRLIAWHGAQLSPLATVAALAPLRRGARRSALGPHFALDVLLARWAEPAHRAALATSGLGRLTEHFLTRSTPLFSPATRSHAEVSHALAPLVFAQAPSLTDHARARATLHFAGSLLPQGASEATPATLAAELSARDHVLAKVAHHGQRLVASGQRLLRLSDDRRAEAARDELGSAVQEATAMTAAIDDLHPTGVPWQSPYAVLLEAEVLRLNAYAELVARGGQSLAPADQAALAVLRTRLPGAGPAPASASASPDAAEFRPFSPRKLVAMSSPSSSASLQRIARLPDTAATNRASSSRLQRPDTLPDASGPAGHATAGSAGSGRSVLTPIGRLPDWSTSSDEGRQSPRTLGLIGQLPDTYRASHPASSSQAGLRSPQSLPDSAPAASRRAQTGLQAPQTLPDSLELNEAQPLAGDGRTTTPLRPVQDVPDWGAAEQNAALAALYGELQQDTPAYQPGQPLRRIAELPDSEAPQASSSGQPPQSALRRIAELPDAAAPQSSTSGARLLAPNTLPDSAASRSGLQSPSAWPDAASAAATPAGRPGRGGLSAPNALPDSAAGASTGTGSSTSALPRGSAPAAAPSLAANAAAASSTPARAATSSAATIPRGATAGTAANGSTAAARTGTAATTPYRRSGAFFVPVTGSTGQAALVAPRDYTQWLSGVPTDNVSLANTVLNTVSPSPLNAVDSYLSQLRYHDAMRASQTASRLLRSHEQTAGLSQGLLRTFWQKRFQAETAHALAAHTKAALDDFAVDDAYGSKALLDYLVRELDARAWLSRLSNGTLKPLLQWEPSWPRLDILSSLYSQVGTLGGEAASKTSASSTLSFYMLLLGPDQPFQVRQGTTNRAAVSSQVAQDSLMAAIDTWAASQAATSSGWTLLVPHSKRLTNASYALGTPGVFATFIADSLSYLDVLDCRPEQQASGVGLTTADVALLAQLDHSASLDERTTLLQNALVAARR